MPKTKWEGAEDPTINNFFKMKAEILNMLFKVQIDQIQPQYFISTEVDRNTPWRQVSSWTHM